jgi:hypothetical protein
MTFISAVERKRGPELIALALALAAAAAAAARLGTRCLPVQFSTSRFQWPMVDKGAITKKGPRIFSTVNRCHIVEMLCTVLPLVGIK